MYNGIINVHKEQGYTSHDVVAVVRKMFGRIKTGHTGTLDPDATGVLPVCIGKATKIADYITAEDKAYRAILQLGIETDTQDLSGKVLKESSVDVSYDEIKKVVDSFIGTYEQLPPMYSAIKVNGKKLYELARKGKEVERKKRQVTFHSIQIRDYIAPNQFTIDIECSKGAYIRTLCHDIGQALGCGGAMGQLVRTRSGIFKIENSFYLSDIQKMVETGTESKVLIPVDQVLSHFPKVYVKQVCEKQLYNGNPVYFHMLEHNPALNEDEKCLVYDALGHLFGIYKKETTTKGECLKVVAMLQDNTVKEL